MATRKDSRGYSLKKGESQRKDGRYVFRYTTLRGEHRSVYAKELSELRKKEVKIRRAIEDGLDPDRAERITLNELFDEYISQKYDLKQSTMTNYKYMYRVQEDGTCTNHVNSPKTKAGIRIIPMIDEVFDAFLEEYQYQKVIGFCTDEIDGYSGFVFCTGDGKVYLPNAINRTIRSICADYNKEEESKAKEENRDPVLLPKFSCHILRHTFCTRFCENETNLKVIQEIMGHADISTTMDVYAEATQEKKKESMTSLQSALLVR